MIRIDECPLWYTLTVKPRYERVVSSALRSMDQDEFLPLYTVRRVWRDRVKELQLPLFSGYVFCRFPYANRVPILRIPGVISIVGFGGRPTPVMDDEIEKIRRLISSGLPLAPWPFLKVGRTIRIDRGPLRGLEGVLLRMRDRRRIIVSVHLLQRSVAVDIGRESVSATGGGQR